jgi:putative flippase GtrA
MRPLYAGTTRALRSLLSERARPLRFAVTGGLAGLLQLALLALLTRHGWNSILANAVALLLSTQVNFALSHVFTWRDRRPHEGTEGTPPVVLVRWAAYQGSVAGTALLNMLVFVATRGLLPPLVASAAGLAAAASGNFVIGDRFVFLGHQNAALDRMTRDRPESAA